MSEWITDRRPMHEDDGTMVYGPDGNICHWTWIKNGDAWKPISKCEPYAKTKRWNVVNSQKIGFIVYDGTKVMKVVAINLPTREAAERIAAIYEEVMP